MNKKFSIDDILSITTGRVLSKDGMDGIYQILSHMLDSDPFTISLGNDSQKCTSEKCTSALNSLYPQLSKSALSKDIEALDIKLKELDSHSEIPVDERNELRTIMVINWKKSLKEKLGNSFDVPQLKDLDLVKNNVSSVVHSLRKPNFNADVMLPKSNHIKKINFQLKDSQNYLFELSIYEKKDISPFLLLYLKEHEMYEKSFELSRFSRLFSFAEKNLPIDQNAYQIFLLTKNKQPIALSILEKTQEFYEQVFTLKDQFNLNSSKKYLINKFFFLDSWFQIFVKKEFRNFGIASLLTKEVENFYLQQKNLSPNLLPLMIAVDDAYPIAKKNMSKIKIIRSRLPYSNFPLDLNSITHQYFKECDSSLIKKYDSLTQEEKLYYQYQILPLPKDKKFKKIFHR
jgi:hypothetical protein